MGSTWPCARGRRSSWRLGLRDLELISPGCHAWSWRIQGKSTEILLISMTFNSFESDLSNLDKALSALLAEGQCASLLESDAEGRGRTGAELF